MTTPEIVALATLCSEVRNKLDKIEQILSRQTAGQDAVSLGSRFHAIKLLVAEAYELTPAELSHKCNERMFVTPRQIAFYLSRKLTKNSLPEIGRYYGGFHHTTVMHSIEKVRERMFKDADYKRDVEAIEARVLECCEGGART